tara:strand:- start:860 stop:1837 length:978 start_codon:yes stop_codon:yes gene_type:complete
MIFFFLIIINTILFLNFEKISNKLDLFDTPDLSRKIHIKPIANIGGILIFLNIIIIIIYQFYTGQNKTIFFDIFPYLTLMFIIGLVDDRIDLQPNLKLFLFLIVILFLITKNELYLISYLKFSFMDSNLELGFISYIFTVFCFLAFINAINMFDGINLHSSIYIIFVLTLFLLKNYYVQLCITILIPILFFSILNFKNKCFIGNNGTYLISFIFSCLFISSYNKINLFLPEEIFLIMFLPGMELIRLTFSRILKKKHPFKGDKNHIHHLLLKKYNYIKTIFISSLLVITPYLTSKIINDYFLMIILIFTFIYIYSIFYLKKSTTK